MTLIMFGFLMKKKGCVITVAQQKGGVGKTTISAHLAVALSQKRNKVAVIDVDPQGSIKHWYNLREDRFGEDYTGLYFFSISGWKINSELSNLQQEYDYIIVDSPPHIETDAKAVIRVADLVIIPVQPSPADLWATKASVALATNEKIPYKLLLNRVPHNSKFAEDVTKEYPKNIFKTQLGNRVAFMSCLAEGKCVTETQPKSAAAEEMKSLVTEVSSMLQTLNKTRDAA
jgi:chromosome partitioning protein